MFALVADNWPYRSSKFLRAAVASSASLKSPRRIICSTVPFAPPGILREADPRIASGDDAKGAEHLSLFCSGRTGLCGLGFGRRSDAACFWSSFAFLLFRGGLPVHLEQLPLGEGLHLLQQLEFVIARGVSFTALTCPVSLR